MPVGMAAGGFSAMAENTCGGGLQRGVVGAMPSRGWEEPAAVGGDQPFGLIYQAHYGVVYSESLECGGCLVGVRRVSTGFLHDDGDLARGRVKPIHWFRRGVAGVGQELLGCGVWGCDEPWRVYDSNGNGFGEVFKNGVAAGVNVGGFANDESGAG